MYLAQYVAKSGVCSRRQAIEYIKDGLIEVNGRFDVKVDYQVKPSDVVKYKNRILKPENKIYVLLNKPVGFVTTCSDEKGRKTVLDLVSEAKKKRLYPVGRLDLNTTGLIVLTNDGDFAQKLSHPKYEINKTYHAVLDQPLQMKDLIKIRRGEVVLDDGKVFVDKVFVKSNNKHVVIDIHSGRTRIIRRLFKQLGYNVAKLDRKGYGPLRKKDLPIGAWRFLTQREVAQLHKTVEQDKK